MTSRPRTPRRRGSVYIVLVGVAMIAAICALAGMRLARAELAAAGQNNDRQRAQLLAQAAVEMALGQMNRAPLDAGRWRTAFTSGQETVPLPLGGGTISFKLTDTDGDLADDNVDPVLVQGIGRAGRAVWVEETTAVIDAGQPLEALGMALHCSGELAISNSKVLTVSGAPASTDGNAAIQGTLIGDLHAVTRSGTGTVTGTATVPAERKGSPQPAVFDNYVARATAIPYAATFDRRVLSPTVNEFGGGLNPDGLYYINTAGRDMTISNCRLQGTLVVELGNRGLTIDENCLLEPYREDYPVLIVKGYAYFWHSSNGASPALSEAALGHNFNPPGAPYLGAADNDLADSYPSEIRGLIHVIGNTWLANAGIYRGAILVQGSVSLQLTGPQIIHDPNLLLEPPWGYTGNPNSTAMIAQPRTWRRQAAP